MEIVKATWHYSFLFKTWLSEYSNVFFLHDFYESNIKQVYMIWIEG